MNFLAYLPLIGLWNEKGRIFHFAKNNIKTHYKGNLLGLGWLALEPILLFIILYVVFTGIRVVERDNFGVYLLSGIILFHTFTRGTQMGLASLKDNQSLLNTFKIKTEFFPVSTTITTGIIMLVEMGVLFALFPFVGFVPEFSIIFLPIVVGMLLMLVLGLSYFLSILFVLIRDVQHVWNVLAHALFFVTPIFWYVEEVKGLLIDIHMISPIGQIVSLGHDVIFGTIPDLEVWLYAFMLVLIIFIIGFSIFKKFERGIVEKI